MLFTILTMFKKIFQVRASALFIPELTVLESNHYSFAFSLRMSLKPGGCIVNGMQFDSCQLCMCHWTIQENNDTVTRINEETMQGKVCYNKNLYSSYLYHANYVFFPPHIKEIIYSSNYGIGKYTYCTF